MNEGLCVFVVLVAENHLFSIDMFLHNTGIMFTCQCMNIKITNFAEKTYKLQKKRLRF